MVGLLWLRFPKDGGDDGLQNWLSVGFAFGYEKVPALLNPIVYSNHSGVEIELERDGANIYVYIIRFVYALNIF